LVDGNLGRAGQLLGGNVLWVHGDGEVEKEKVEMSPSRPTASDRPLVLPDIFVGWLDVLALLKARLC